MKKNKLFKKNEAVHYRSHYELERLLYIASKHGVCWRNGISTSLALLLNKSDCINFNEGKSLSHGSKKYYKEQLFKAISTEKFLKRFKDTKNGWYKDKRGENKFFVYLNFDKNICFGFGVSGVWFVGENPKDVGNVIKATNKEAKQRLIEEAKRRGFAKGVVIDNSSLGFGNKIKRKVLQNNKPKLIKYGVFGLGKWIIMKDGKWSEIIKDKPKEPKIGDFGLFYDNNELKMNSLGFLEEIKFDEVEKEYYYFQKDGTVWKKFKQFTEGTLNEIWTLFKNI